MINNPKRMIAIGIAFVLVLASIISSPYIIFYSKKHIAKGYLEKTDIQIQQIIAEHRETEEFLNTNKKLYKEYENYKQDLKNITINSKICRMNLPTITVSMKPIK